MVGNRKYMHFSVSEEERIWIHDIARANRSSISGMIMEFLESKSRQFGIAIPKDRVNRGKLNFPHTPEDRTSREKQFEKIDRELGLR